MITFEELNFFSNNFKCNVGINETFKCSYLSKIVPSSSHLGECNTFLHRNVSEKNRELEFSDEKDLITLSKVNFNQYNLHEYMVHELYILSSVSMPSL